VSNAIVKMQQIDKLFHRLQWRHVPIISIVGGILTGAVIFLFLPLRYTASTTLLLSEHPDFIRSLAPSSDAGQGFAIAALAPSGGTSTKRLDAILKSTRIVSQLVDKYKLTDRLHADEEEATEALRDMTTIKKIGTLYTEVGIKIQVTSKGSSRLYTWLGLSGPFSNDEAQQLCADLANDYVAALDTYITETSVQTAAETRQFIDKRHQDMVTELADTEDKIETLQTKYSFIDPEVKASGLIQQTRSLAQVYAVAKADTEDLTHSLETARERLSEQDKTRIKEEVTARNPVIATLDERLAELRVELERQLKGGATPSHPDVVELQASIDGTKSELDSIQQEIRQQISRQVDPAYDTLVNNVIQIEVNLAGAHARQATYSTLLQAADEQLSDLPPVTREYVRLARLRSIQTQLLTTLATRLEIATIEEKRVSAGKFDILDEAQPPLKKSGPSSVRSAAIAFVLLMVVLGLALGWREGMLFSSEPID